MNPVAKAIEEQERVIVRFAGDSGDGMQLAGGRFTDATAAFGNDLSTLPNFPAEIRAPAGTLAGVSELPDPLRGARHPYAGRHAQRPRRDEPGGAQGERPRPRARRHDPRQRGRVHQAQPARRPATRPTRSTTARSEASSSGACPMNTLTQRAVEGMRTSRRATRCEPRTSSRWGLFPGCMSARRR